MTFSKEEKEQALKNLTAEEYKVTQEAATEYPLVANTMISTSRVFTLMCCLASRFFQAMTSMMQVAAGLVLPSRLRS